MENAIDQLFRSKLSDHPVAPSHEAWEKMEAQLSKRNKPVIAWRMAAAILLAGLLVLTLVWLSQPVVTDQPRVSEKKNEPTTEPIETVKSATPHQEIAVANTDKKANKNFDQVTTPLVAEVKKEILLEQPLEEQPHLIVEPATLTPEVTVAEEKALVIEFVLEDVPQQPAIAEAAPEKENGFKKVVETVIELKNGERSLGLRQAMNDLLAFNHKKEDSKIR